MCCACPAGNCRPVGKPGAGLHCGGYFDGRGPWGFGAEPHVRPFWGTEALWGYWEFGGDYLSKRDWKIVAVSQEAADPWKARNLIDDDPETFYYPKGQDFYEVVIDLGQSYEWGR